MPKTIAESILSWGKKNIANSDLYTEEKKYGRENEIHVTVKYGLHTADVRKVQKVVEDFGSISRFVPKDKAK